MQRFTIPRYIYHGKGSVAQLENIEGKKAVIVTGKGSMKKTGFLDKVVNHLGKANIEVKIFEEVEADPSIATVHKGVELMNEFSPDWIISLGGGSAIDAAKAMWIFFEHPNLTFEDTKNPFTIPELRHKAKFIAIPSTSGTATEVTAFSIITDGETGIKYPIADFNITPDIAIIDPLLAETMPESLVAHTGMDALSHAVEAYVSTVASPFTDALALESIEIIMNELTGSYKGDLSARESIHYAQCMAGMAFSNALLGIIHSMSHKTGALYNIPHGCANAIYMPYVVQFNKKNAADRYAKIAKRLNLEGTTNDELIDALCAKLKELNKAIGIPVSLKEYGLDEATFKADLSKISQLAISDACTGSNPRQISQEEMEKLFLHIYEGTDVKF